MKTIGVTPTCPAFERTSKRRKGFPSETRVKRGLRFVRGGEKGAGRKARPQRSLPVRVGEEISSAAACTRAGFDGRERHDYWR